MTLLASVTFFPGRKRLMWTMTPDEADMTVSILTRAETKVW